MLPRPSSAAPHAGGPRGRPQALAASPFLLLRLLLLVGCIGYHAGARRVAFDNTAPMRDRTGRIMDAHDGTVQRFHEDGPFYMHAVSYGLCEAPTTVGCDIDPATRCGFRLDHNVSIYSSWDLSSGSWRFEGHAFPWTARTPGTLFRPSAVHNPATGEYVLWWNYVHPNGTYAGFAAATAADSPVGPFTQRVASVNITYQRADVQAGDFKLFVDPDDGAGYVIYSAGFWVTIEKLTPDFLGVTGEMMDDFRGNQAEWGFEAPVMFKRGGLYYILFGPFCCFCYQGSGVRVYTSRSALGPYTYQGGSDIACQDEEEKEDDEGWRPAQSLKAEPTPGQGCLFYGEDQVSVTRAQQNCIIEVPSPSGETQYVWTGDRWMQSPDGLKGHEPQFWAPLAFDEEGRVGRMAWVDRFELDVAVPVEIEAGEGWGEEEEEGVVSDA